MTGEKAFFDCPVRLHIYGTSDGQARARLETALKKDKLLKATQLKQTKSEAEAQRKAMGLSGSQSTVGLNGEQASADTMAEILQASETVDVRKDADAIKSLAISEDQLAKLPTAEQPSCLKAQLLPYQLQVSARPLFLGQLNFKHVC